MAAKGNKEKRFDIPYSYILKQNPVPHLYFHPDTRYVTSNKFW